MAKEKVIKNGYKKYILEGVKLYLFCLLFSLISLPGLALENPVWAVLFAAICYLPAVALAFIMGKGCGVEAYRHTRRIKNSLKHDSNTVWTPAQKFFAFHWAKGLIPAAVFAVPQLIFLLFTFVLPHIVTRSLLVLANIPLVTVINAMGYNLNNAGPLLLLTLIPILAAPAIYYAGYVMSGFTQRAQYIDIADEIRRFGG